jgi:lysophospholipid acyltransferase (LPLAT)-like uncharacterized protein
VPLHRRKERITGITTERLPLLQIITQIDSYFLTVPSPKDRVYQFADLSEYSAKERLIIRLADLAFSFAIRLIAGTTRFEIEGQENLEAVESGGRLPIYTFWHDRILLATYFFRGLGIVVLTSKSFDGEYIARFIQRFGYGAIRGSSSRGGSRALVEMIKKMRGGLAMAFTADGPRGPRYEVKAGPIILAKKTGNPVVPFVIEPKRRRTAGSWDRMQIPWPFGPARVLIGEPIYVDGDADEAQVALKTAEVQGSLDRLVQRGREWSGRDN